MTTVEKQPPVRVNDRDSPLHATAPLNQLRMGILRAVQDLPEFVAISPIDVICPHCSAEPGDILRSPY
jgi:hypothetical protein